MRLIRTKLLAGVASTIMVLAGCQGQSASPQSAGSPTPSTKPLSTNTPSPTARVFNGLAGMPAPLSETNVYAASVVGQYSAAVQGARELVYVPNGNSDNVSVIDPKTFRVIDTFYGGDEPQHVVPSYDMKTLYVTADQVPAGTLTPIDPKTGKPGRPMAIQDPYNLYFTPDGRFAIVVAEYYKRLDFYDSRTWQPVTKLSIPDCDGINHMDFTTDGRLALVTCEFANKMIVLDVAAKKHVRTFQLPGHHGMPQDCRLSPDGKTFYVADMMADGVYLFNGDATKRIGFIPTGDGAHGLYFSRDASRLFVTNRNEGTVTVINTATRSIMTKWTIPGGGSPDMGAVSGDGKTLWLSGRSHDEVYVFDTASGRLLARIPVGSGPHGLTYWPQPGRYSLGHTSNIR